MRDIVRLDLIVLGQLSQKIHACLIEIALTKSCSIGFLAGIGPDNNLHTFSMQETDQVFLFGRKTSKAINDQGQILQLLIRITSQNMLCKSSNLRRRIKIAPIQSSSHCSKNLDQILSLLRLLKKFQIRKGHLSGLQFMIKVHQLLDKLGILLNPAIDLKISII